MDDLVLEPLGELLLVAPTRHNAPSTLAMVYDRELGEADIAALREPNDIVPQATVNERLSLMQHRHHLAARMIADGTPLAEVGYATRYSANTLSTFQNDPAFAELVRYYAGQKEKIYLNVHERIGAVAMLAVERIGERLEDDERASAIPVKTLSDIANSLLDRSLAPSKFANGANARADLGGGLTINLNFDEKPASAKVIEGTASTSAA